jgi:hypothetical protein
MPRWIGVILVSTLLAACGGSSSSVLPKAGTPVTPAKTKIQVSITMHVPGAASAHNAALRRRFTIAQNTAGAQVNVYNAGNDTGTPLATTTANIEPSSSPGSTCTASDAYGNRSCTFDISAPVGTEDFAITTWDQAPSGASIPGGANELGWGLDPGVTITAGSPANVSTTLSSVLASVSLDLAPAALHQIIPATGTIGVYALDADNDVIVSNGFVDPNGNPITINLNYDNSLNGALYLSTNSISAPSATGVQYFYAPSGVLNSGGNQTVNFSASSSYGAVITSGAALSAVYPSFVSITDGNLNVNNTHHGGIVFDTSGGVDYTTPNNYGGISYFNGSGGSVTNSYSAMATAPILGSIVTVTGGPFLAITGNQAQTFGNPLTSLVPVPNMSPAPVPNGSAVAFDPIAGGIWYTSGSSLVDYPVASGSPNPISLGVNASAGVAVDSLSNVWVVDNVDSRIIEYPGPNNPLQPGGAPWDVLINSNGIYVTDHGPNPAIIQLNSSGNIVNTIPVPGGAVPWYMMPDNAQPGIVWFDCLVNGQIGIGRMDTNVNPVTFVVATDLSGPFGAQAGAIGAASNGLVYMVFDGTSTLVQVSR